MDQQPSREHRIVWAFWLACGLAAVGGLVPVLLSGTSGRVSGVIIPFWFAAVAFGACGMLYRQGKPIATGLYFVAGLAVVYGILAMLAVPLRLAVVGTCPPAPAHCAIGYERPLTGDESTGLGFAAGIGIVAVLVGFFGLVTLYRRFSVTLPAQPPARRILPFGASHSAEPASPPPVRRIPPVGASHPPEPAAVAPAPAPEFPPALSDEPELPAPEPELELPAPAPEPELPAHTDGPQAGESELAPAAVVRPRRKRARKAPPDSPLPTTSGA